VLIEALVWTVVVEVTFVRAEHATRVTLVVDQHPVGVFGADAADEPFGIAVRPRRPGWDLDDLHVLSGEHGVERAGKLRVSVPDQVPEAVLRSPKSVTRLRACWVVQAAVGWAVTPRMCTRRVAISITTASAAATSRTSAPRSGTAVEQPCTASSAAIGKRQLTPCASSSSAGVGYTRTCPTEYGRTCTARRAPTPSIGLRTYRRSRIAADRAAVRPARAP
jgi:hypothetical protein